MQVQINLESLDNVGKVIYGNFNNKAADELTKLSEDINLFGRYFEFSEENKKVELYNLLLSHCPKVPPEPKPPVIITPVTKTEIMENMDTKKEFDNSSINDKKKNHINFFYSIKPLLKTIQRFFLKQGRATNITMLLGIIIAVWGYHWFSTVNNNDLDKNTALIIISVGSSIFTGGFVNKIAEWAKNNDILRAMSEATIEAWEQFKKIRYKQRVQIVFSTEGDMVIVDIDHWFSYNGEPNEKIPFSISSDCRIYTNDVAPEDSHFRFQEISIGDEQIIEWDNISSMPKNQQKKKYEDLSRIINNKLIYEGVAIIPEGSKEVKLHFKIRSTYQKRDRMVWSFQELSPDGATIKIIRKGNFFSNDETNVETFPLLKMWVNHPTVDSIYAINQINGLQSNGLLSKNTCSIKFANVIIPYQGFELFWDIK